MVRIESRPIHPGTNPRVHVDALPTTVREATRSIDSMADEQWDRAIEHARLEGARAATQDVLAALAAGIDDAVGGLEKARERAEAALASDAVELAVQIARQIVKVRFDAGEYDLETIVRSTLAAAGGRNSKYVLHVSIEDARLLQDVSLRDGTEVLADPALERGHVHLETPQGLLVRDPEAALDEIREQLLEDLVR